MKPIIISIRMFIFRLWKPVRIFLILFFYRFNSMLFISIILLGINIFRWLSTVYGSQLTYRAPCLWSLGFVRVYTTSPSVIWILDKQCILLESKKQNFCNLIFCIKNEGFETWELNSPRELRVRFLLYNVLRRMKQGFLLKMWGRDTISACQIVLYLSNLYTRHKI